MLAALALLVAAAPQLEVRQHVVIVGVNASVDEGVAPLEFADDDAARYAEALGAHAASVRLLAVMDEESQRIFPEVSARAVLPTRRELERALGEAFADVSADRRAGREADLLFIFVGHGAVDGSGEGYVSLLDGRLTREELFATLLEPSPARFNHVVVDACSAYRLLHRGDDAVAAVRRFLRERSLAAHPNTGVLLATSSERDTHEWAKIRGGVFSHEVLSALSGAADVDDDGVLAYAEVGAFIEAANAAVDDPRARIDFFLRPPPALVDRPLLTRGQGARLSFARDDVGHYFIEDARGVAVAELHKNDEQALAVSLAGRGPWAVRRGEDAFRVDDGGGRVGKLAKIEEQTRARGAVDDALARGLFRTAFGRSYVAGYAARLRHDVEGEAPPAPHEGLSPLGVGVAVASGASLVGAAVAGGFVVEALLSLEQGRGSLSAFEAEAIAKRGNAAMITGGALAAAALVGGVVSALLLLAPPDDAP